MFRLFFERQTEKENKHVSTSLQDSDESLQIIANILHFLGKMKLELETDMTSKKGGEQSEYEVHLQRLEAQIREHIRVINQN